MPTPNRAAARVCLDPPFGRVFCGRQAPLNREYTESIPARNTGFLPGTGHTGCFEAPAMFKRDAVYFVSVAVHLEEVSPRILDNRGVVGRLGGGKCLTT